jgi:hypothetical protein
MTEVLTTRRLNRALLARQALLERQACSVPAMVERLVGLQAQEPAPPFVGLWSRVAGFEREELLTALRDRTVERLTAMRGTIHLLTPADVVEHRMALQPVLRSALRLPGAREVTEEADLDAVLALAHRLLREEARPIAALRGPLHDAFPQLPGEPLAFVARMLLPLVMLPQESNPVGFAGNAPFVPAESVVGPLRPEGPAHALVRRYLAAFGPSTAADVTKWSGLTGTRALLEELPGVARFADEAGRTLYDLAEAPRPPEDVPAPVRFLPRFDNALLAHADHSRILDPAHRARVFTANGHIHGTVLRNGFAVATWHPDPVTDDGPALLRVRPFARLPQRAGASIRAEGRRLLRLLAPAAREREVVVEATA